jgi:hypothetical protein
MRLACGGGIAAQQIGFVARLAVLARLIDDG